jgi:hypothetical protein
MEKIGLDKAVMNAAETEGAVGGKRKNSARRASRQRRGGRSDIGGCWNGDC